MPGPLTYSRRLRGRIELSLAITRLVHVIDFVHIGAFVNAAFAHEAARRCLRAAARAGGVLALFALSGCVKAGVTVKAGQPMRVVRSSNTYRPGPVYEPMTQRKLTNCGDCGQGRLNVRGARKRNSQMKTTWRKR